MHIYNPVTGEKRGYGFVDFVDESSTRKALAAAQHAQNKFEVKGQRGHFGKYLPQKIKRDLMYIEDRFGNLLLKQLYQKVPESGKHILICYTYKFRIGFYHLKS
jgi:hypothetical protein